jgi:hypothetical protein
VPRKPTGRPPHRPIKDPAALARALELVDSGMPATEVAEHPDVKGRVGQRTIYDAIDRRRGKKPRARRPAPKRTKLTAEPPRAPAPDAPPTEADRKIDELVARSRTWRRVTETLAEFAREHPAIAPALAAKLRSLNL